MPLHLGYRFGGPRGGSEMPASGPKPHPLKRPWRPALPPWVSFYLSWFEVRKPFENFCGMSLPLWLTHNEEISKKAWPVDGLWRTSTNPEGTLGRVDHQFRGRALSGCVWSVSWFLDFQWTLQEQNWIQRFILIVRRWSSRARGAGALSWAAAEVCNRDSLWGGDKAEPARLWDDRADLRMG